MSQLLSWYLLWLVLLLVRFSRELSADLGRARKLCGRHLLQEIVKLCGDTDWSHFEFPETPPSKGRIPQASRKGQASKAGAFKKHHSLWQGWRGVTHPASTSATGQSIFSWEIQSLPEYQYKKINLIPDMIREASSLHDINPHVHEDVKSQKKTLNKIKTINHVFWGNHPQRKRRGFSDKCCLKGCTKEELAIACLPYIDS
ncbi:PREDICTED: insulin-like peptide INSL6 [Dipodomys ordii]|uniref:Insulin-like peptide INSL6 n=1 Tax=Dipodomys ordii TaxID=10020 RepID=A0A1S3FD21_DIPOR|nr:PREDICTED: insulin-like peptide INSL6 [Dipodomys ordii]